MAKNNKKNKESNPLFIITIFLILILSVLYGPNLYDTYFSDAIKENNFAINSAINNVKEEEKIVSSSGMFNINNDEEIDFNEINIESSKLYEKEVVLNIKSKRKIDLEEMDYYIEFYENNKFIGRRLLLGKIDTNITSLSINVENLNLTSNSTYMLSHISNLAIPQRVDNDTFTNREMICTNKDIQYKYIFDTEKLIKIIYQETKIENDLDQLAAKLLSFQSKVKNYNDIKGVNSAVVNKDDTIIFTGEFNYNLNDDFSEIKDRFIYPKNTSPGVVQFKSQAEGFEC